MAFGGGSALVQLVALGLPAAGSVEAPIPIRIVFDAPEDCSTEEAFYQGVRSRTDRVRRAEAGETGTELGVRVSKTSGKVHGELDLIGEHGESDRRVVNGETCSEVVEALSLTAALALDPDGARFARAGGSGARERRRRNRRRARRRPPLRPRTRIRSSSGFTPAWRLRKSSLPSGASGAWCSRRCVPSRGCRTVRPSGSGSPTSRIRSVPRRTKRIRRRVSRR